MNWWGLRKGIENVCCFSQVKKASVWIGENSRSSHSSCWVSPVPGPLTSPCIWGPKAAWFHRLSPSSQANLIKLTKKGSQGTIRPSKTGPLRFSWSSGCIGLKLPFQEFCKNMLYTHVYIIYIIYVYTHIYISTHTQTNYFSIWKVIRVTGAFDSKHNQPFQWHLEYATCIYDFLSPFLYQYPQPPSLRKGAWWGNQEFGLQNWGECRNTCSRGLLIIPCRDSATFLAGFHRHWEHWKVSGKLP